jgi:DNA-binding NarL/FixJ family response regulator
MDNQMPGIDGLETTIRIRQNPNPLIAHIKVVALTASALKGDQEKFMAVGADGYLSKVRLLFFLASPSSTLRLTPLVSTARSLRRSRSYYHPHPSTRPFRPPPQV